MASSNSSIFENILRDENENGRILRSKQKPKPKLKIKTKTETFRRAKALSKSKINNNSNLNRNLNYMELNANSSCARVISGFAAIRSMDITIAANPEKYLHQENVNKNNGNNGKTNSGLNALRQGLGVEIYRYPCMIILKA